MWYSAIAVAFILFLIPIGVMVANYKEMRRFEYALSSDVEMQLKTSRDMQTAINMTQGVVIASARQANIGTSIREDQFREIMAKLNTMTFYAGSRYSFEQLLPYILPKDDSPLPLLNHVQH